LIGRTVVACWLFLGCLGTPKFVFQFYWGSFGAMNNLLIANILDTDKHMLGELNARRTEWKEGNVGGYRIQKMKSSYRYVWM